MTRDSNGMNYRVSNREDEITFYCGLQKKLCCWVHGTTGRTFF